MSLKNEMFLNFSRLKACTFEKMQIALVTCKPFVSVSPKDVSTKVSLIFVPWKVRSFGKKSTLMAPSQKIVPFAICKNIRRPRQRWAAGKAVNTTEGNIWH